MVNAGTIQSWFERYMLEHHETEGNVELYKTTVRCVLTRYLIEKYGAMEVSEFGIGEAEDTIREVETNEEVNSQQYANRIFSWFHHYFNFVLEHGGTDMNPYDQVDKPVIVNSKK